MTTTEERGHSLRVGLLEKAGQEMVTVGDLDTAIGELLDERDALQAKLDCDTCNSGHKTLPLTLWDCPVCAENRVKAVEEKRDRWKTNAIHFNEIATMAEETVRLLEGTNAILRRALLEGYHRMSRGMTAADSKYVYGCIAGSDGEWKDTPELALAALVERLKEEKS